MIDTPDNNGFIVSMLTEVESAVSKQNAWHILLGLWSSFTHPKCLLLAPDFDLYANTFATPLPRTQSDRMSKGGSTWAIAMQDRGTNNPGKSQNGYRFDFFLPSVPNGVHTLADSSALG